MKARQTKIISYKKKKITNELTEKKKRQNFRISMMGKSPEGLVKGADELDALRLSCLTA